MTTEAEDREHIIDSMARVIAASEGHLNSYKTHEFYRRETKQRAELLLELMESWDLKVTLA